MDPSTLFWLGCIPARLGLAAAAAKLPDRYLPWLAGFLAVSGGGLIVLWLTKSRLQAHEGGGVTWWNSARPVHGALLLTGAGLAWKGNRWGALPLALDAVLGGVLQLSHRGTGLISNDPNTMKK